jgi:mono/diheme cytochrome c family protein
MLKRALLAALLGLLAIGTAGCGTGGLSEGGSISQGQRLFKDNCGTCHTLAAAGTSGTIGPNLDAAFQVAHDRDYKESTIREVVAKQIMYPTTNPPTEGAVGMPANIVEGQDVDDVAAYVACAAGVPKDEAAKNCGASTGGGTTPGGGGGGGTDGKAIFASAGCSSCHTFKAAGSSGTVGPNLDQVSVEKARAVKQVTNGGGGMPPFKDQLTQAQIDAVATFVVENRSK